MSGSVGVERIFPVNLPALQKLKSTKVQFVELEFSTLENLLVKAKKDKKDSQTSLYHKSPISTIEIGTFCFSNL
jgi:hypothetical protein